MAHRTKAAAAEAQDTGIARLVEAERQWRDQLTTAETAAAELVAQARRDAAEADAALERELAECIAEHRAQVTATLAERVTGIEREATRRADAYRTLPDAEVQRLAARLLAEVWWSDAEPSPAEARGRTT